MHFPEVLAGKTYFIEFMETNPFDVTYIKVHNVDILKSV